MANDVLAQKAQNFTNRGRQALEARRYDLAVELLSQALDAMPDLLETRRLLRAAQIAKFRENPPSGFALKLQSLSNMGKRAKILSRVKKGKGAAALAEAQQLLGIDPLDPDNIECAVKAAEAKLKDAKVRLADLERQAESGPSSTGSATTGKDTGSATGSTTTAAVSTPASADVANKAAVKANKAA